MNIFSTDKISKAFKDKVLFNDISFGMEDDERIGIIGRNGAGKTTLLKIVAGVDKPDSGIVTHKNDLKVVYLDQLPQFDSYQNVIETVMEGKPELSEKLIQHAILCKQLESGYSEVQAKKLESIIQYIDQQNGWELELNASIILHKLGMEDHNRIVHELSGGLRKRVALARALLSEPDLLILDEPTNHLDADSVQWLQDYLMNSSKALIFVTHDRYFLDAVATRIIELDDQKLYNFPGNYEKYLEQKQNIEETHKSTVRHQLSRLRDELVWLQKGAKARRSKQKSKIEWIDDLKNKAIFKKEKKIEIELGKVSLNSRIIDAQYITKSLGGKLLFNNFTYLAKPGDRIGIIGPNGSGKTTFLRVLAGLTSPDEGKVLQGINIKIGYFKQEISDLKDDHTVISSIREIAEYIDVGEGRDRYLTARDLLEKFLFPRYQHNAFISTLSGGEKRRLALIRVLMSNPNVLMLDEPTNDFDIHTLHAFENYLDDFQGVLLTVSHDRAFLDRTINYIYAFDGKGNIKEYPGDYSYYLDQKESDESAKVKDLSEKKETEYRKDLRQNRKKIKLSYKEQRELEQLELAIPKLEAQKAEQEKQLNKLKAQDYQEMHRLSQSIQEIDEKIDTATMRWLELSDLTDND